MAPRPCRARSSPSTSILGDRAASRLSADLAARDPVTGHRDHRQRTVSSESPVARASSPRQPREHRGSGRDREAGADRVAIANARNGRVVPPLTTATFRRQRPRGSAVNGRVVPGQIRGTAHRERQAGSEAYDHRHHAAAHRHAVCVMRTALACRHGSTTMTAHRKRHGGLVGGSVELRRVDDRRCRSG